METKVGVRLSKDDVFYLLTHFDDSSDHPLHEGLDFNIYSEKLSKYAYFVLAFIDDKCIGFIAYYLNEEGKFIYVPQVVVHKEARHQGVGHYIFGELYSHYSGRYSIVELEVLKDNFNARNFYERECFKIIDDHDTKLLLSRNL